MYHEHNFVAFRPDPLCQLLRIGFASEASYQNPPSRPRTLPDHQLRGSVILRALVSQPHRILINRKHPHLHGVKITSRNRVRRQGNGRSCQSRAAFGGPRPWRRRGSLWRCGRRWRGLSPALR